MCHFATQNFIANQPPLQTYFAYTGQSLVKETYIKFGFDNSEYYDLVPAKMSEIKDS